MTFKSFSSPGTALVVQWLGIHLPMQGVRVQSLVKELRSHMYVAKKLKKIIFTVLKYCVYSRQTCSF